MSQRSSLSTGSRRLAFAAPEKALNPVPESGPMLRVLDLQLMEGFTDRVEGVELAGFFLFHLMKILS